MSDVGVVNYAPERYSVELREIPRATIAPDQVLMEVQAVGVCGSDLHMWADTPSWPVNYPVVLGHEFCGIVREVGAQVRGWREGDRAVSETAAVVELFTRVGIPSAAARMRDYMLSRGRADQGHVLIWTEQGERDGVGFKYRVPWPLPNVWLGVSAEDQPRADERIPHLLQTPAAVRFVSAEPLLGPVDLQPYLRWNFDTYAAPDCRLDWVIVGGESGPGARPCHWRWIDGIVRQCRSAGVA